MHCPHSHSGYYYFLEIYISLPNKTYPWGQCPSRGASGGHDSVEVSLKFTTERDSFADAVAWVSRTVSTRPTLPVLGGTLIELLDQQLRLASTDLEHTGEAIVLVRGAADGRVVVPGRIFGEVVRNLPTGVVDVEAVEGGLTVRCGQVSHELRLLDAEDFPTLAQPSLEQ